MTSAPPMPPDVARQMQPSSAVQFVGQGGPMPRPAPDAAPGGGMQGFQPEAFLEQKLTEIAASLKEVADVVIATKPAAAPYLKAMIAAGAELMDRVKMSDQPAPDAGQVVPGNPVPQTPAGAVSMG